MSHTDFRYCPNCGKKLIKSTRFETNYCNGCGTDLRKVKIINQKKIQCTICHEYIWIERNKTIQCSFCGSRYHFSCVSAWLKRHNSCPMCQNVYLNPVPSLK